jgi:hypothetical protein
MIAFVCVYLIHYYLCALVAMCRHAGIQPFYIATACEQLTFLHIT